MRSLILTLFGALLLPLSSNAQVAGRPMWEQEAMLLYSSSSSEFTRLRTLGINNPRLANYTRALEVLHESDDEMRERYEMAQEMFQALVNERDNDAVGLGSRYYLARIMQSHPMEQDIAAAKEIYFELFEDFPDRFFGQMSFLKYATLEIYDESDEKRSPQSRIQGLEQYVSRLTSDEIKRNYHRVMGEAYATFELDPASAYSHLKEAYDIGLPVESIRVDVLARMAEMCESLNKLEDALLAYDELLLLEANHERKAEFAYKAKAIRASLAAQ